jgi:hypothetical protein
MLKVIKGGGLSLLLALVLLSPVATLAQVTVTSAVRDFEILAVDGNHLVVRGEKGTRELTVPPDFRFTVDGKSMATSDLKAGMKGTAMITTTTIERPVYVTTVKSGTVIRQSGSSVLIKDDKGEVRKFTQSEVDARGIRIYIDDKPTRMRDLQRGDTISATIVTAGAPEVLTVQEVNATLAAEPEPAAVSAQEPVATPDVAPVEAAPLEGAPTPEPQVATEEAAPEAAATESTSPFVDMPKPYTKHPFFWLLVAIVVVALIWVLVRRRAKKPAQR